MKSDSGRDVSVDLFKHMGKSCPNLKILDLTQAIGISGDALVHLFFHDAYTILHQVRIVLTIIRFVYCIKYWLLVRVELLPVLLLFSF